MQLCQVQRFTTGAWWGSMTRGTTQLPGELTMICSLTFWLSLRRLGESTLCMHSCGLPAHASGHLGSARWIHAAPWIGSRVHPPHRARPSLCCDWAGVLRRVTIASYLPASSWWVLEELLTCFFLCVLELHALINSLPSRIFLLGAAALCTVFAIARTSVPPTSCPPASS